MTDELLSRRFLQRVYHSRQTIQAIAVSPESHHIQTVTDAIAEFLNLFDLIITEHHLVDGRLDIRLSLPLIPDVFFSRVLHSASNFAREVT